VFTGGARNNLVVGNYIGSDVTGNVKLGNGSHGILMQAVDGNTIGGTAAGAGNVIVGSFANGVHTLGNSAGDTLIQGNLTGPNPAGTAALGNGAVGIVIQDAPDCTIGGTAAGAGNLVSGNGNHGILLLGTNATRTIVQGNKIGTNLAGTAALSNAADGM